jgi:hypothetical protein
LQGGSWKNIIAPSNGDSFLCRARSVEQFFLKKKCLLQNESRFSRQSYPLDSSPQIVDSSIVDSDDQAQIQEAGSNNDHYQDSDDDDRFGASDFANSQCLLDEEEDEGTTASEHVNPVINRVDSTATLFEQVKIPGYPVMSPCASLKMPLSEYASRAETVVCQLKTRFEEMKGLEAQVKDRQQSLKSMKERASMRIEELSHENVVEKENKIVEKKLEGAIKRKREIDEDREINQQQCVRASKIRAMYLDMIRCGEKRAELILADHLNEIEEVKDRDKTLGEEEDLFCEDKIGDRNLLGGAREDEYQSIMIVDDE